MDPSLYPIQDSELVQKTPLLIGEFDRQVFKVTWQLGEEKLLLPESLRRRRSQQRQRWWGVRRSHLLANAGGRNG
ncbi:hypothetical protein SLA2020_064530 [Shorea laevis]